MTSDALRLLGKEYVKRSEMRAARGVQDRRTVVDRVRVERWMVGIGVIDSEALQGPVAVPLRRDVRTCSFFPYERQLGLGW